MGLEFMPKSRILLASIFVVFLLVGVSSSWSKEEKTSSAKPETSSSVTLKLVPIDRRPITDCYADPVCYFFTFSVVADGKLGDKVIYDQPGDVGAGTKTYVVETTVGEVGEENPKYKSQLYVVNAKTPVQCVQDKECAWFAFYNSVFSAAFEGGKEKKLHKRDNALEYWAEPKGQKAYMDELDSAYDRIRSYVSIPIIRHNKFSSFLLFSDDLEQDALVNYRNFFAKVDQGTGINAIAFNRVFVAGQKGKTCANFPFIQGGSNSVMVSISFIHTGAKYRQNCINESVYASVGLSTLFKDFPFVITNQVGDEKDIPPSLTSLDLFMIYLLYQPEFKSGMPVDLKILRPIFDKVYSRSLENFMKIYSKQ